MASCNRRTYDVISAGLLSVLLLVPSLYAQDASISRETDGLTKGYVIPSTLLAGVLGIGGAIGGLFVGYGVFDCSDEGPTCNSGPDNGETIPAAVGLGLGSWLGAHLGGRRADSEGKVLPTMFIALSGSLMTLAFALTDSEAGVVTLFATPVAAAIMNTQNRKPRNATTQSRSFRIYPVGHERWGAAVRVQFY
jgi:hypothetical protein